MKWPALILLTFICLACGGMLPGKITKDKTLAPKKTVNHTAIQKRLHLSVLESKYLKEDLALNLAIVRGMIMELEGKNGAYVLPDSLPDLKDLRKRPSFLALELTVEHLSHRESVKQNPRHSNYLNPHLD